MVFLVFFLIISSRNLVSFNITRSFFILYLCYIHRSVCSLNLINFKCLFATSAFFGEKFNVGCIVRNIKFDENKNLLHFFVQRIFFSILFENCFSQLTPYLILSSHIVTSFLLNQYKRQQYNQYYF